MRIASRHPGFTLIELLCVIALIAILAALLLPALSQAGVRAKRVQCLHQLQQASIAFQEFAHDHNSEFPMAVPASAGGALDAAQNAYRVFGEFYFSYRYFQVLSNELVNPGLLVCPADARIAATNFASLQNSNLSYFVGLNAEWGKPTSILAGDRNITNEYPAYSLLHLGANYVLRWTRELHQFKGNVLFADGHVEELNNAALARLSGALSAPADLAMPTLPRAGGTSVGGGSYAGGGSGGYASGGYAGPAPAGARSMYPPPSSTAPMSSGGSGGRSSASTAQSSSTMLAAAPANSWAPTQAVRRVATVQAEDAATNSASNAPAQAELATSVVVPVQRLPWFSFSPLLLLLLLAVAIYRQERARRKALRSQYRTRR